MFTLMGSVLLSGDDNLSPFVKSFGNATRFQDRSGSWVVAMSAEQQVHLVTIKDAITRTVAVVVGAWAHASCRKVSFRQSFIENL